MEENERLEVWAEILKAMAHPVRLCILQRLHADGVRNVTTMQECLEIPQSTVSQHLSILRNKGIIKGKRKGLEITYSISNKTVEDMLEVIFDKETVNE